MTKLSVTILITFLCSLGLFSQNVQTKLPDRYENKWAKVAEFEKKSLPQSAAKVVDTILRMAIQEKDSPQVIKALIHQGKYDLELDAQKRYTYLSPSE